MIVLGIIFLILLNIVDVILTIIGFRKGMDELNPIVRVILFKSIYLFFLIKIIMIFLFIYLFSLISEYFVSFLMLIISNIFYIVLCLNNFIQIYFRNIK